MIKTESSIVAMFFRSSGMDLLLIFLSALSVFHRHTRAFNMETSGARILSNGQSDSYFGYSVDFYKAHDAARIIVGAPRAQSVNIPSSTVFGPEGIVERSGAVYTCPLDSPSNVCRELPVDTREVNIRVKNHQQNEFEYFEVKSGMWLGATVQGSPEHGAILTCAPKYARFEQTENKPSTEPVGRCYIYNMTTQRSKVYHPCVDLFSSGLPWGYHETGSCQAGFNAKFLQNGKDFVTGAAGSYYWQGQVYIQSVADNERQLATRQIDDPTRDNTYLGYSIVFGRFGAKGETQIAASAPKASRGGELLFYDLQLRFQQSIKGGKDLLNCYFGYAMTVADFDGDSRDDLAVSSPLYIDPSEKSFGQIDVGRVDIFYQRKSGKFPKGKRTKIFGKVPHGRFGLAISAIGDINHDGFIDLAVGAPYEGEAAIGAVYIFLGSRSGIKEKPSQIIKGSDISRGMLTFGSAISGGIDVDNNKYPDMVVGAYGANAAVFLRGRPIVTVDIDCGSDWPKQIDLKQRCAVLQAPCFTTTCCFTVSGTGIPDIFGLDVEWDLDSRKNDSKRMFFADSARISRRTTQVTMMRGKENCDRPTKILVSKDPKDKLTQMDLTLTWTLVNQDQFGGRNLFPVLDGTKERSKTLMSFIQKDCGNDNTCIPDLVLKMAVSSGAPNNVYQIGSRSTIELTVSVVNKLEDAYAATAVVHLADGVTFVNAVPSLSNDVLISCANNVTESGQYIVTCDLGNPLAPDQPIEFTVVTSAEKLNGSRDLLIFKAEAISANSEAENTQNDNSEILKIGVVVGIDLAIFHASDPEQVSLNETSDDSSIETFSDAGPRVVHLYELLNHGPSNFTKAEVHIRWPSYYWHKNSLYPLFYLVKPPEISNVRGSCWAADPYSINNRSLYRSEIEVPYSVAGRIVPISIGARSKREVRTSFSNRPSTSGNAQATSTAQDNLLDCSSEEIECSDLFCSIEKMSVGDFAVMWVEARVWSRTAIKLIKYTKTIRSNVIVRVTEVPYKIGCSGAQFCTAQSEQASTRLNLAIRLLRRPLNLWIIAVSVAVGLLVLLVLILVLWKCGFFYRKRFHRSEERAMQKALFKKSEADDWYY